VAVVERPEWNGPAVRLDCLVHDGERLTPDAHRSCPGHAAFVTQEWVYPDDSNDGDDSGDGDGDGEDPISGQVGPSRQFTAVYVCTDPAGTATPTPPAPQWAVSAAGR